MWIVRLALRRPYTFVVMAVLIAILGGYSIVTMPVDIFPYIDIPIVSVIWSYGGLSPEEMEKRVVTTFERNLSANVNDIEHIESQCYNGIAVVRVYFHPNVQIDLAVAQMAGLGVIAAGTFGLETHGVAAQVAAFAAALAGGLLLSWTDHRFGKTQEAIIGVSALLLVHPGDVPAIVEGIEKEFDALPQDYLGHIIPVANAAELDALQATGRLIDEMTSSSPRPHPTATLYWWPPTQAKPLHRI